VPEEPASEEEPVVDAPVEETVAPEVSEEAPAE